MYIGKREKVACLVCLEVLRHVAVGNLTVFCKVCTQFICHVHEYTLLMCLYALRARVRVYMGPPSTSVYGTTRHELGEGTEKGGRERGERREEEEGPPHLEQARLGDGRQRYER